MQLSWLDNYSLGQLQALNWNNYGDSNDHSFKSEFECYSIYGYMDSFSGSEKAAVNVVKYFKTVQLLITFMLVV